MLPEDDGRRPSVRVANPSPTRSRTCARRCCPGCSCAGSQRRSRLHDVALYETGPVFRRVGDPGPPVRLPVEPRPSADQFAQARGDVALPADASRRRSHRAPRACRLVGERPAASWADAVEAARTVARAVGVDVDVRADVHAPWHPGRCAAIEVRWAAGRARRRSCTPRSSRRSGCHRGPARWSCASTTSSTPRRSEVDGTAISPFPPANVRPRPGGGGGDSRR